MGLLIALLWALAYILVAAIVIYMIIYVLQILEVPLPAKVIQLLWVLLALIALIIILTALLGHLPSFRIGLLPGGAPATISAQAA